MRRRLSIVTAALLTLVPSLLLGQPRASERGTVSQIVNGTTLTLDFSRPVARGRDNLFGGVVHWGETWTPGANWATTLETDGDLRINGHALAAGRYSVWMRPQPGEWTVLLHRDTELYHDSPVPDDGWVLDFPVMPQQGAHMETLMWYFPVVSGRQAELRLHWGATYVAMTVETPEFVIADTPAELRSRYVGSYRIDGRDPTTGGPLEVTIGVLEEDGRLVGRWGRAPIALVPKGNGEFRIGFMRGGSLFDVGDEMSLRLVVDGERAVAAELLWMGEPFARGDRVDGS